MLFKTLRPVYDAMIPATIPEQSVELHRQYMVLVSLILICTFFLVTLGIITTLQGETFLSLLDFSIAIGFLGMGIVLKETGKIQEISSIIVTSLAIYFYYLFFYTGLERTTWVWYYTFPLWAIFLKGKKSGSLLSITLIFATMGTYFFMAEATKDSFYSGNLMIRLFFSYSCVVFVTYVMEDTRAATYRKLVESNQKLSQLVEELNATRGELHELSIRDAITGLFHRRHFDSLLKMSLSHSNRYKGALALLLVDINNFKAYNNQEGFHAGDAVLKMCSRKLLSQIRREADSVSRFAGDTFAIILNNCSPSHVETIASMIRHGIEELRIPHALSPYEYITVTIGGIILSPETEQVSQKEVLSQAEAALRRAKQRHGKKIILSTFLQESVKE